MKKNILIIAFAIISLTIVINGILFMKVIPKNPVVKHGEFPFCLTYEYDEKFM